jgi:hypothetical protein
MTETEWLDCGEPLRMALFLHSRRTCGRQIALFGCACCRRIWHLLSDERCRKAVEVLERSQEGLVPEGEVVAAWRNAYAAWPSMAQAAADVAYNTPLARGMSGAGLAVYQMMDQDVQCCETAAVAAADFASVEADARDAALTAERSAQFHLLRDIVGNPFRPVSVSPSWLSGNASLPLKLAQALYEERHLPDGVLDSVRMAVLADALEDAGCTDADLLDHCRSGGVHVRGCWVLDLLLEKR